MKFGIHKIEGKDLGERLKCVPSHLPVDPLGDEGEWYPTEALALAAINGGVARSDLAGKSSDYHIQPYSDDGHMLEKVMDLDREQAMTDARVLMETDKTVLAAVASLVAVRQMHAMTMRELDRHLVNTTRVGKESRQPHPLTLEVFTQSAAAQASVEFSELELFEGLTQSVFPWLQSLIKDHVRQDKIQKEKEFKDADEIRRKTLVPVGLARHPENTVPLELPRNMPMVLVGFGPAVRYLLTHAGRAALAARVGDAKSRRFVVARFADIAASDDADGADPNYARLGRSAWETGAASRVAFHKKLREVIQTQLSPALSHSDGLIDLLLVDDLAALVNGVVSSGAAGHLQPARVATALHWIGDWASFTGLAVMAGVPTPDTRVPDLSDVVWNRVRDHCDLCAVSVLPKIVGRPGDTHLQTIVISKGTEVLATLDVDASLLVEPSKIVQ